MLETQEQIWLLGKYISFIDSDDYIDFDMIEFLYTNAYDNNCDISICSNYMVDENEIINLGTRKILFV